ncbi:MAG: hypothetical protein HFH94_17450 [Lachnospiraceae bacterium]|nr:Rpn family recombination-promoting nuclease/putative transposase [uncultured Acetatifactor sp.]MCI9221464.1 hypothetical protein [Lachnospiraceae bacterium]
MGEPNNALAVYMNRSDRIRSVLEYYIGEKLPQDWQCEEIRGFYTIRNTKGKLSFRQRDFLANVSMGGMHFKLALENQDSVNLIYPWRLMELDCLAYGREIEEIQERNIHAGESYRQGDDFKYHYKREDRIEPILDLTLYGGKEKWKSPLGLRELMTDMRMLPRKMTRLVGDYRVNLIPMRAIPESELQKMDSDLKYVLGFMKHTSSRKRYEKYIRENRNFFTRIPRSAVDVIDACTNIKDIRESLKYTLNEENGEEEGDMCKALDDIKKHAEKKGERKGERRGNQRTNKLIQVLLTEGRQEDLLRSATDSLFQQQLFQKYHI